MVERSVRDLLRRATTATLATIDAATGHPYASLVEVASAADARPVLLLSGLARHTRNLLADPRASLLIDQRAAAGGALPAERATLIGTARTCDNPSMERRYLARFPAAAAYAGFGDFSFWVIEPAHAHVIAGFGRIRAVAWQSIQLVGSQVDDLARQETDLLSRVNAILAVRPIGAGSELTACAVDTEGVDVRSPQGVRRVDLHITEWTEKNIVDAICC